jgi:segregation and condensation protein A
MQNGAGGGEMAVQVRVPAFEGPLDLLLYLIGKNKVDIYDIPIHEITEQYIEALDEWNHRNMEIASEFIVMAATLIEIKARMLLPPENEEEEEEDPREELVQRLLAYKRYKEAAARMKEWQTPPDRLTVIREREDEKKYRYYPSPERILDGVSLEELAEMFRTVLQSKADSIDPVRANFRSVERENFTIEDKIKDLMSALEALDTISFMKIRGASHSRQEEIMYFLALLELDRNNLITLKQEKAFADILVSRKEREPGSMAIITPNDEPEPEALPEPEMIPDIEPEPEPGPLPDIVQEPEPEPVSDIAPEPGPETDEGEQNGTGNETRDGAGTDPKKSRAVST